jgi:ABC-type transport system involved in multi-copper enzyme maturation permease subunit
MTTAPVLDLDTTRTPAVPFGRLTGVEFRKAYDTRAGFWLLLTIGTLVAAAELIYVIVAITQDDATDISWASFAAVAGFITSFLLPVLGIMLVTTEWTQRSAMVTFTLESRRTRVVLAKLVVGLLLTAATIGFALVVGAVFNAVFALSGGTTDWLDRDFRDGVIGFAITQTIAMVMGFAFAALLLNTAAAIVVYYAYSLVLPGLIALGSNFIGWFADLAPWIDFNQAQQPLMEIFDMTGEEWGHLLVSGALWLGVPLFFGLRRILRAEVK